MNSAAVSFGKKTELRLRRGFLSLIRRIARSKSQTNNLRQLDLNNATVLLLRQNMIGDALISTPVIAALRDRFPNMTIDVVLDKRNQTVFDFDTNISTRYVLKKKRFDQFSNLKRVREKNYDVVVDLIHSASVTSTAFCWLGNAGVTIGPKRTNDFVYDIKVNYQAKAQEANRVMRRIAEVLRPFGIDPDQTQLTPYFTIPSESEQFGRSMSARVRAGTQNSLLVGVNISGGSKPEKFWDVHKFITLINQLSSTYPNAVFVILNSPDYQEQATRIIEATTAQGSGKTKTLHDFAACIRQLDLLITTDSSAVHFADIDRVPVVDLLRSTEKPEWLPSQTQFEAVYAPDGLMASIDVDHVVEAFNKLVPPSA